MNRFVSVVDKFHAGRQRDARPMTFRDEGDSGAPEAMFLRGSPLNNLRVDELRCIRWQDACVLRPSFLNLLQHGHETIGQGARERFRVPPLWASGSAGSSSRNQCG